MSNVNAERGKKGFQPVVKNESMVGLSQPDYGFAIGSRASWTDPDTDETLETIVIAQDNEYFFLRTTNGERIQAFLSEMSTVT